MRAPNSIHVMRSVRAKLLVVLVLLSLPLLIISLIQLRNYRLSLEEQELTIARAEIGTLAITLESWLGGESARGADFKTLSSSDQNILYERLRAQISHANDSAIAVFDEEGRLLRDTSMPSLALDQISVPGELRVIKWSDGHVRSTLVRRIEPYGWSVALGLTTSGHSHAGRSILMITATWAVALVASTLLAVWAVGRYTKPVRKLAASVSTLGRGDLRERIDVETDDEVGILAEGFNTMAEQLEAKFAELKAQRSFIEEVIDSLPLGLAVLDDKLTVKRANPTFARFVGRDAASLMGRGMYEAAAGLAVLSDVIEDVRRTRKPFLTYGLALELIVRSSGENATPESNNESMQYWDITLWPITARGADRGDLVLILSEVSKRVRAERLATSAFAAERARAAELESLINQVNEGVVIVDRQGRYRINPAAAEIIGRKSSEFRDGIKALLLDIALRDPSGQKLPLENTPILRAFEKGEHIQGEQLKILRTDGEVRVLSVSATPLMGEAGTRDGAVALFRDITEEVSRHDELVAAYDRLREHDRLKSAFVATVSHEFRTPLNVIIGLCQLLERDRQLPLAPLQSEAIIRMERNARSLLELVNDLLDYSRLEAGRTALKLESVNVREVVEAVIEDYRAAAKNKRIEIRGEVSEELGNVITDRRKLTQVLSNLVNNAIKFTSVGSVSVLAGPEDDGRWFVEVRDTGIGITSEALTYVFDEFRQADDTLARAYGGTGLGLAITRKVVELLNGTISVNSRPNEGSHFHISWPRIARPRTGTGSLVGDLDGIVEATSLRRQQAR